MLNFAKTHYHCVTDSILTLHETPSDTQPMFRKQTGIMESYNDLGWKGASKLT